MLQKTVYRLLAHRHPWRTINFDELSQLYVSVMFRRFSLNLTGLFVPIYLLHLGYSIVAIFTMFGCYFTFRTLVSDLLAGFTVAKIGPKHTLLAGNLLLIISTALFLSLSNVTWPLWLLACVWGASTSYYFVPLNVDFSKVKHSEHGGKELGYVNIMDKLGAALGPLIGGVLGTVLGAQYIFLVAAGLLIVGTLPLFQTIEPVRLHQQLDFTSLPADRLKHDFLSYVSLGIENTLSMFLWPLFLGVFVLLGNTVYAKLGILVAVSVTVAMLAARMIGKLIDERQGRYLLRTGAILNGLLHLVRPFIGTYTGALAVNVANEAVTISYRMPYLKGMFDAADDLPGYRIVYITSMEMMASCAKATVWWLLALFALLLPMHAVMIAGFSIAAVASYGIMVERYKALNPKPIMEVTNA
jgi:MFS family permease